MRSPRRILVIALRRLGDLLLATPLIHALRQQWPEAVIDVLAAAGTEAMLEGNPDVSRVIVFSRGRGGTPLRQIARRYDLAVTLQPEDRGHLLAWLAAPCRASIVPAPGQPGRGWKRWLSSVSVDADLHNQHAVVQYGRLAAALGLTNALTVIPPRAPLPRAIADRLAATAAGAGGYAVVHPAPMYPYKAWPETHWRALVAALVARGLPVVVTGGPAPFERTLAEALAAPAGSAVLPLAGELSLAQLTPLLAHARVFIGPDTATTHLAAAASVPTIALFGPSNPVAWGPWPQDCPQRAGSPWQFHGARQQHGNVWLLQGTQARRPGCIPCLQEGCERHRDSRSDCLDSLPPKRVLEAVDEILGLVGTAAANETR